MNISYIVLLGVLLFIVTGFSIFFIRNLLKQNEQLVNKIVQERIDVISKLNITLSKMRDIDNRQMFEKDDDVGVLFSDLEGLLKDLLDEISKPEIK